MILQQTACQVSDVRNWINDGSSIPDWVRMQMSGEIASNGTFLIATPVGTARVHPGDVVIEHQGQLWSRSPDEVPQLIDGLVQRPHCRSPLSVLARTLSSARRAKPGREEGAGASARSGSGRPSENRQASSGYIPPS